MGWGVSTRGSGWQQGLGDSLTFAFRSPRVGRVTAGACERVGDTPGKAWSGEELGRTGERIVSLCASPSRSLASSPCARSDGDGDGDGDERGVTELPPTDVVPELGEAGDLGAEFDDDEHPNLDDSARDSPDRYGGARARGRGLGRDSAAVPLGHAPEVILERSRLTVSRYEAVERRLVDIWHRGGSGENKGGG